MSATSAPLPAPLSNAQGHGCHPLDDVLLDFILLDDEVGDEFIYLGENPTELGAEVLGIVMAELVRHQEFAARLQSERVCAAMVHEVTRVDKETPVELAGFALYLTEISTTPYAARRCVIDVAAALRRSGFTALLALRAEQHPQRPSAGWRQMLQRRHKAAVYGTVADEHRPHAGAGQLLLASLLLSSLSLTTGSPSRSAIGEPPPSTRIERVGSLAASIFEPKVDALPASLRAAIENHATAPAAVLEADRVAPPSLVSSEAEPRPRTVTRALKQALKRALTGVLKREPDTREQRRGPPAAR